VTVAAQGRWIYPMPLSGECSHARPEPGQNPRRAAAQSSNQPRRRHAPRECMLLQNALPGGIVAIAGALTCPAAGHGACQGIRRKTR
jgi:hypothetical protein